MLERAATYADVRAALVSASGCWAQDDGRWKIEGLDVSDEPLTLVVEIQASVVVVTLFRGEVYIEGPAGEAFDLAVAAELARAGETAGEALAFIRKAVGLSGIELAELFDLTLGTVSRLEHGKAPPDRRTVALLAALVKDQAAGRDGMLATLRSLQRPRRLGKSVKVAVR